MPTKKPTTINMSNNKQTAVEWLFKKLQNREKGIFDGLPYLSLDEIYNHAKEMEKQQIMDAWMNGAYSIYTESAEKYYNEEYGKQ